MKSYIKYFDKIGRFVATVNAVLILIAFSGCRKFTEVSAPTISISSANVFTTDATAIAAVTAFYSKMGTTNVLTDGVFPSISGLAGLSSDEFSLYTGANQNTVAYYTNSLSGTNSNATPAFWVNLYSIIYQTNAAIEGLNSSASLTPQIKQQLLGEAYFCRALCYFYLVNLYGDVPLALTTDYKINALLTRTDSKTVYNQIITDLKNSKGLLSKDFLGATLTSTSADRVRPTIWAASALLARTYLYNKDWTNAASEASLVINNTSLFGIPPLDNVFLKNSLEAIWQLQPVNTGETTPEGATFVLPVTGPSSNQCILISPGLLNSFEPNDQRKIHWVNSVTSGGTTYYFPDKYKKGLDPLVKSVTGMTEYSMVLRLGEQYLIRAEAEANGGAGGLPAAIVDINAIRTRAGLPNYSGAQDQISVLNAIYQERRVELFSEWAHRWLDLKRTGTIDAVMGTGGACAVKGGTWDTKQQLYPIPLSELQVDPKLVQNPGY